MEGYPGTDVLQQTDILAVWIPEEKSQRNRFGIYYHIGDSRILTLTEDSSRKKKSENPPRIIYTGGSSI